MGLLSRLRSRSASTSSAAPSEAGPTGQQPGAASQPEGDGPVTLEDRTEPGGLGSPDTNQGKTEPMSTADDDSEGFDTPSLASMNVGANDAQAPGHPAAQAPASSSGASGPLRSSGGGAGSAAGSGDPTGQVPPGGGHPGGGPTAGDAHHAPGLQGATPAGEAATVDVEAGAAAMRTTPGGDGPAGPHGEDSSGSGDTGPAPGTGDAPLAGSSEELPVVQGIRRPEPDGA